MDKEVIVSIDEATGEIRFVHDDTIAEAMSEVGKVEKTRATHVEPVNWFLRVLFYFIRNRVDDRSWIANLTRRIPCLWRARLLDTNEIIGTGRDRAVLIEKEVQYLEEERI